MSDQENVDTHGSIAVPLYRLKPHHFTGLRSDMLSMGNVGGVSTESGLGGDGIWLEWRGAYYLVRGSELLRALVRQIEPESADAFPNGVEEVKR